MLASVFPYNANNKEVEWISSDKDIVSVSQNGLITAVAPGNATITCTAKDGSRVSTSCDVTVIQPVTGIDFDKENAELLVGESLSILATVSPSDASNKELEWTSSDSSIASVNQSGVVTASKPGTATITCIAKDGSGIMATCIVNVLNSSPPLDNNKPLSNDDTSDDHFSDDADYDSDEIPEAGDKFYDAKSKANYTVIEIAQENHSGTLEFTATSRKTANLTIPETVTIDNITYKITVIGDSAFKGNTYLKKIIIGDNVTTIGTNAFNGCKNLATVAMGKKVSKINSKAFYKCTKLQKITIPKTVKTIGSKAFYGCTKLKNITIKTTMLTNKKIGSKAFKGIYSKATIKVPKSKLSSYKKILKAKGVGSKVKIKK